MKPKILLPLLFASLLACGPVEVYHRPGVSLAARDSDLLDCRVEALEKAPVATQIRQGPPTYIPSRRYCRSDGRCYTEGGFFAPGEVYSVDVNARLRGDLEARCMAARGYSSVALPRCPSGTGSDPAGSGPAGPADRMPELGEQSCVQRDAAGNWRIIDPRR